MTEALGNGKLRQALKFSSTLLCELKTNLLTPTNYHILFMQIFDELRGL